MAVRIHLDNPHAFYTNLDFISGKIILSLRSNETVTTILVKLEGVSNSRLVKYEPPPGEDGKTQYAAESHKILYKVQQVFPTHEPALATSGAQSYTLPAGQHEYPFRFKFPFNNGCATFTQTISFGGIRLLETPAHLQDRHVTKTLPPSLSGFPQMAEIRYFVKVTVGRPSIWKGNRRAQVGYKFLPIEPPRPPPSNAESFARRAHTFQSGLAGYPKKQGMFSKKSVPLSITPPSVVVDARLPNPSILTCNEPVPLRLLVKKQALSPEYVFLVGLQIELIGFTHIRAREVSRVEVGSWMIMSLAGLAEPVSLPNDAVGSEFLVDSQLWDHLPLPHTVTPSFDTCNLRRTYDIEIRVTIGYGHRGDIQVSFVLSSFQA
jgi:Arrestin (or S-antigen), N-terminal domain